MSQPDDLSRCEEMLQDLDVSFPVYVFDQHDERIRDRIELPRNAYGITSWRWSRDWELGPDGFTTVIATEKARNGQQVQAWVLHELAHYLESCKALSLLEHITGKLSNEPDRKRTGEDINRDCWDNISRPWDLHKPSFARLCVHLHYRAWRKGWHTEERDVFTGDWYRMPGLSSFRDALNGEFKRLSDVPLTDLESLEPPESFKQFTAKTMEHAEQFYQEETQWKS